MESQSDAIRTRTGSPLATGVTAADSALRAALDLTASFYLSPDELVAGMFDDGQRLSAPVGVDAVTGASRFTLFYFHRAVGGIPVFDSDIRVLVANRPENPAVWASTSVRPMAPIDSQLDDSTVTVATAHITAFEDAIRDSLGAGYQFVSEPRACIWNGTENVEGEVVPSIGLYAIAKDDAIPSARRVVYSINGGEIVHSSELICTMDISGNVSGTVAMPEAPSSCVGTEIRSLGQMYLEVGGIPVATTDLDGNFTLPNPDGLPVTIDARLAGPWFYVLSANYPALVLSQTTAGTADFLFNTGLTVQEEGQVNAFVEANFVRDFVKTISPGYPGIDRADMLVVTNRQDGFCPNNAWYDPTLVSINFCGPAPLSGRHTAWSTIIYHEYGHHVVREGGGGQGQYGEGFSDTLALLINDNPDMGYGFGDSCAVPLRTATTPLSYPCTDTTGPHYCGQLISGAFWETRNEFANRYPTNYIEVLSPLVIDSAMLHIGVSITPQIATDLLILDDDDADLSNGTPHIGEICRGFETRNLDCPGFEELIIKINKTPELALSTDELDDFEVEIYPVTESIQAGTEVLNLRTGGRQNPFQQIPLIPLDEHRYFVPLPEVECGTMFDFYISARSESGHLITEPKYGQALYFVSVVGNPVDVINYDFETDPGWTVTGNVTGGAWQRGTPHPTCNRGEPNLDYDGSGQCWITEIATDTTCNTDIDNGTTTLTSNVIDVSSFNVPIVRYARWFENQGGGLPNDVFRVEVAEAGGPFFEVESVGPTVDSARPEVTGGWYERYFRVDDFLPDATEIQVRFVASDTGSSHVVEAAIDAFAVVDIDCSPAPCTTANGDLNGDSSIDARDLATFVSAAIDGSDAETICRGDYSGNGLIDANDIPPFVAVLLTGCDGLRGDVNSDGVVNGRDIAPFAALLLIEGADCSADLNQSGSVNLDDVAPFVAELLR